MPNLSIVCPTFNRSALLYDCLGGCARMGTQVEIVMVDDCSTDDTRTVLEDLRKSLAKGGLVIRCFATAKNSGAQICRNLGLAHSSGKFVMFMDSDDVPVTDGIRAALQWLEAKNCDFIYGKVQQTDELLNLIPGALTGSRYSNSNRDLAGYHWHTMGAIYRRELLERVGPWDESLTGSQDWEFQARVKIHARSNIFCDSIMGLWRQHQSARVGTRIFRYDYTHSVVEACKGIAQHTKKAGRYDRALANRLAKKMFLHGLEFSVHGFPDDARRTFSQVKLLPEISPAIRAMMGVFACSPRLMNLLTFRAIRGVKGA